MARYQTDETGTCLFGYFFMLYGCKTNFHDPESQADWILSQAHNEDDLMRTGFVDMERRESRDCPRSDEHVTGKYITKLLADVFGGLVGAMVPNDDHVVCVNESTRRQLERSPLVGTDMIRLTVNVNQGRSPAPPIYVLTFPGKNAERTSVVVPPEANKCPFCGTGPVFCPQCGAREFGRCPTCGEPPVVMEKAREPGEKRILFMGRPDAGEVIDAAKWDGSDFFGGLNRYVTRRALDFLLSIQAAPFLAQPIRAYVDGCNDEQREKLEAATRPFV